MAWADEISALFVEHEYLTELLMIWLTASEFLFLLQAQLASAGASVGHRPSVWTQG